MGTVPIYASGTIYSHSSNFKAVKSEYYISFYWLDFLAKTKNIKIDHYLNSGKETKILGSKVQYYLDITPTLRLLFFGIMAGWHYREGGDLGL